MVWSSSGPSLAPARPARQVELSVVGTQLADLVGFPVARYVMEGTGYRGPLLPIVQRKMYVGPGWVRGLKIFP